MEDQKHTPLPWRTYADPKTGNQDTTMVFSDEIGANGGNTIARFFGPDREANAALFMDAPGMKAEIEAIKGEHEYILRKLTKSEERIEVLKAECDAAIEALNLYHRVEVTKLKAEIESFRQDEFSHTRKNPY